MPLLVLNFTPTIPPPQYGYFVKYRKQGETVYKIVSTLESPLEIPVATTGVYEGVIMARCTNSMSPPVDWTAKVCPPMTLDYTFVNHPGDLSKTDVTASATGGVGPYGYVWSDGQTGPIAYGLVKTQTYTVTVTDSEGCSKTEQITPNVTILSGLNIEIMYFESGSTNPSDINYGRPSGMSTGHVCNRARFELNANSVSLGIANMNNAGGTDPDNPDDQNMPPTYPNYSGANARDRYYIREIQPQEAEQIADDDGIIFITTTYIGTIQPPHSDAVWIRISKQDGTILDSTTINAFDGYEFDPYVS